MAGRNGGERKTFPPGKSLLDAKAARLSERASEKAQTGERKEEGIGWGSAVGIS